MGMLDVLRDRRKKRAAPPSKSGGSSDLFDEEFQRKLETLAIVSRRVFAGRIRAERRSKKKGSGLEFADHRDYVPGDDFRFVDFGIYQRFGRLLVRLYEEEEDLSIYFLLDCSRSMAFGDGRKFDQARRLVAALGYVGLSNLDRITVVGVGDRVEARMPTTRGKARIFTVFRFLRSLSADSGTDLGEALKTFVAQHKRRGLCVLVSDLYDPAGFERGINVLRYNGYEPYVLHVVDPSEAQPPVQGDVRVYDCETGEEREVTVTDRLLSRLKEAYGAYTDAIEGFCKRNRVPYFRADVNTPFDELVLGVFRRGGFLR